MVEAADAFEGHCSTVFLLPELVELIVSFLNRSDCVSAARISTMWTDPALNNIWSRVDSFQTLLQVVLPKEASRALDFRHYIPKESWSRLRQYASRIRVLTNDDDKVDLASDLVSQLQGYGLEPGTLFPRLIRLKWVVRGSEHVCPFLPSVGGSLQVLTLDYPDTDVGYSGVSNALWTLSSCSLPRLRTFCIRATAGWFGWLVDPAANAFLAKNGHNLTTLYFKGPTYSFTPPEDLAISIQTVTDLACQLSTPVYESAAGLVKMCPNLQILKVNIFFSAGSTAQWSKYIEPLFNLHDLSELQIRAYGQCGPITADDILTMGGAWPRMRSLSLSHTPWGDVIALSLLFHFSACFPLLEHLTGAFRWSFPLPAVDEHATHFPNLRTLNFMGLYVPAGSGKEYQRIVDAIFPCGHFTRNDGTIIRADSDGSRIQ
ncbi:hypothetical protein FRB99_007803 [Tulasnella sp. 403]|nr:hypothetical protein FRB99_007803 [Tulasnella sp. 403]